MALPLSFPVEDADASIQRSGVYTLEDEVVGTRIKEFSKVRFPTKTPLGFEFIAKNTFVRKDIHQVLTSTLDQPYLGFIKVFGDNLPSEYAFRFHNGSSEKTFCLLALLWRPDSKFCFYDGSMSQEYEDDALVSQNWGLLATPKQSMKNRSISEKIVELKGGGLSITDSRLNISIIRGYAVMVGFTTEEEVGNWGKMELPYSDDFRAKIKELNAKGIHINYTWLTAASKSE